VIPAESFQSRTVWQREWQRESTYATLLHLFLAAATTSMAIAASSHDRFVAAGARRFVAPARPLAPDCFSTCAVFAFVGFAFVFALAFVGGVVIVVGFATSFGVAIVVEFAVWLTSSRGIVIAVCLTRATGVVIAVCLAIGAGVVLGVGLTTATRVEIIDGLATLGAFASVAAFAIVGR
jgi:hypothetical protein